MKCHIQFSVKYKKNITKLSFAELSQRLVKVKLGAVKLQTAPRLPSILMSVLFFSELEVRYPRFLGNSFLALPVLKTGYKSLDILLEFKPTAKYGLLFFSAEFEDARSDFFSVALINGFVEFR